MSDPNDPSDQPQEQPAAIFSDELTFPFVFGLGLDDDDDDDDQAEESETEHS